MSPRSTGLDEAGRPIVAELGRAETAQETADRRSAASAKRRASQTALNLAIATVVCLVAAVGIVALAGLTDTGSRLEPVDHIAAGEAAQTTTDELLAVPELPDGWTATRARLEGGTVTSWQIGFTTPGERYLSLAQGLDADRSWVDDQVRGAAPGPVVRIGGLEWTSYDRRDVASPGNVAYALVTASGGSTIVLAGTADDDEFETLALAVAQGIAG